MYDFNECLISDLSSVSQQTTRLMAMDRRDYVLENYNAMTNRSIWVYPRNRGKLNVILIKQWKQNDHLDKHQIIFDKIKLQKLCLF